MNNITHVTLITSKHINNGRTAAAGADDGDGGDAEPCDPVDIDAAGADAFYSADAPDEDEAEEALDGFDPELLAALEHVILAEAEAGRRCEMHDGYTELVADDVAETGQLEAERAERRLIEAAIRHAEAADVAAGLGADVEARAEELLSKDSSAKPLPDEAVEEAVLAAVREGPEALEAEEEEEALLRPDFAADDAGDHDCHGSGSDSDPDDSVPVPAALLVTAEAAAAAVALARRELAMTTWAQESLAGIAYLMQGAAAVRDIAVGREYPWEMSLVVRSVGEVSQLQHTLFYVFIFLMSLIGPGGFEAVGSFEFVFSYELQRVVESSSANPQLQTYL